MFTIIFYLFLVIGICLFVVAIKKSSLKLYIVGGLLFYIVSFLGSFSIGLYILVFTFILWTLAIVKFFKLLEKPYHQLTYSLIAIPIWLLSITFIDDYWLFYPFAILTF